MLTWYKTPSFIQLPILAQIDTLHQWTHNVRLDVKQNTVKNLPMSGSVWTLSGSMSAWSRNFSIRFTETAAWFTEKQQQWYDTLSIQLQINSVPPNLDTVQSNLVWTSNNLRLTWFYWYWVRETFNYNMSKVQENSSRGNRTKLHHCVNYLLPLARTWNVAKNVK